MTTSRGSGGVLHIFLLCILRLQAACTADATFDALQKVRRRAAISAFISPCAPVLRISVPLQAHAEALTAAHGSRAAALAEAAAVHDAALSSVAANARAAADKAAAEHAAALEALRASHAAELAALRAAHDAHVAELTEAHAADRARLEDAYEEAQVRRRCWPRGGACPQGSM